MLLVTLSHFIYNQSRRCILNRRLKWYLQILKDSNFFFQFQILPPEPNGFLHHQSLLLGNLSTEGFESSKVAESQVQDILWQQVRRGMAMVDELPGIEMDSIHSPQ